MDSSVPSRWLWEYWNWKMFYLNKPPPPQTAVSGRRKVVCYPRQCVCLSHSQHACWQFYVRLKLYPGTLAFLCQPVFVLWRLVNAHWFCSEWAAQMTAVCPLCSSIMTRFIIPIIRKPYCNWQADSGYSAASVRNGACKGGQINILFVILQPTVYKDRKTSFLFVMRVVCIVKKGVFLPITQVICYGFQMSSPTHMETHTHTSSVFL